MDEERYSVEGTQVQLCFLIGVRDQNAWQIGTATGKGESSFFPELEPCQSQLRAIA